MIIIIQQKNLFVKRFFDFFGKFVLFDKLECKSIFILGDFYNAIFVENCYFVDCLTSRFCSHFNKVSYTRFATVPEKRRYKGENRHFKLVSLITFSIDRI